MNALRLPEHLARFFAEYEALARRHGLTFAPKPKAPGVELVCVTPGALAEMRNALIAREVWAQPREAAPSPPSAKPVALLPAPKPPSVKRPVDVFLREFCEALRRDAGDRPAGEARVLRKIADAADAAYARAVGGTE